jgi:hypothetical protein
MCEKLCCDYAQPYSSCTCVVCVVLYNDNRYNEAHALQAELATWAAAVTTRAAEAADVDAGLTAVTALRDRLTAAAAATEQLVAVAREELPGAVAVLMGASPAADVALELAGESQGGGFAAIAGATSAVSSVQRSVLTPAQRLRRLVKEEGWAALSGEEKRFIIVDRCALLIYFYTKTL